MFISIKYLGHIKNLVTLGQKLRAIPLKHTTRGGPHFEIGQTPFRSATICLPPHVRTIFFQYIPPFRRDFYIFQDGFSYMYVCMYVCTHLFKLTPTMCLLKMSLLKYFYRMFFVFCFFFWQWGIMSGLPHQFNDFSANTKQSQINY